MENLLPLFVALTGAAVLLQACLLGAMYLAIRKTSARMEAIATEFKDKSLPVIESTQTILLEVRPKLQSIAASLEESTKTVRDQIQRADATVNDVVDRARLQVIRADELLSRTLDRVEQTSDMVHRTVVSPIRQVSGVMQGITAGLEFLVGSRGRKNGSSQQSRQPVPQDEMFI